VTVKTLLSVKKSAYEYKREKAASGVDCDAEIFLATPSRRLDDMIASHDEQKRSVDLIKKAMDELRFIYVELDPDGVADEIYHKGNRPDFVIAAGGDGTVLRTAQYLTDELMLGVKTDKRSEGYLCGVKNPGLVKKALLEIEKMPVNKLNRIEFAINGQTINNPNIITESILPLYALNEGIFCSKMPFVNTQFEIIEDGVARKYKELGLIMAPATGSTAILKSDGGELMNLFDTRIQYLPVFKRSEKPKYTYKLTLRCCDSESGLKIDGARNMISVSDGAIITAAGGKALNLLGRIRY